MRRGFTFIEALVVLGIIAIIAGLGFELWVYTKALPKPWGMVRNIAYGMLVLIAVIRVILSRMTNPPRITPQHRNPHC